MDVYAHHPQSQNRTVSEVKSVLAYRLHKVYCNNKATYCKIRPLYRKRAQCQNTSFTSALSPWHIVFTLCLPALLFAQPPTIYTENEAEAYNDLLRDLEGISLELNRASAKDLLILPGLTPELARRIIARRPYRTLKELAKVQGLSEEHIDLIAPYLSIAPSRPWRLQYTSRVTRPSKRANSFGDMRLYQRLEISSPTHLSAFFLTERDPEEPTLTDHVTGYIALPLSRIDIILGDVRPEWGQGLLFSRRTRSATGLSYARARSATQSGNRTSTEHGALRGIYLSGSHTHLFWSLMYGRMTWDATFGSDTRIYTSGLHHTETSQARKNALRERLTGANIAIGSSQKHIGLAIPQHGLLHPSRLT